MVRIGKWELLRFKRSDDNRGSLCFGEVRKEIPFAVQRVFWVFGTPTGTVRGHHAHREGWQVHICLNGWAKVSLDNGREKSDVTLDSPDSGLLISPHVWHSFQLSSSATLFVLTSNNYDETDYLRHYDDFLKEVRGV